MSPRRRPTAPKVAGGENPVLAAIDLGSNSFHMVVARRLGDDLQIIDRAREGVRLAAALDEQRRLTEAGMTAALECLERFGQRLRDLPPESVRIVGTNTLRQAKNGQVFLERAQRALGHEIEVVSGHEEARLIYLGASHSVAIGEDRSLVVDIGGGSTECIVGRGTKAELTESLYMGCVSWSQRYFADGVLTRERFRAAEIAARLEVQQIKDRITDARWVQCWGTSGTIRTIRELLRIHGWGPDGITRKALRELRKAMIAAGRLDQLRLEGLPEDRLPVLPGGLAILWALIKDLEIDRMLFAPGALREGLLYDLIGRLDRDDVRDRTIRRLIDTYDVDVRHARRVAATAGKILAEVARSWRLGPRHAAWLERAAMLHEIGLALSHSGFHKHGAYIVRNSHLAGYSLREQRILATLILAHRRKWPKAALAELAPADEAVVTRLALVLRLAVLLERTRTREEIPTPSIRVRKDRVLLSMPEGWLDDHPLTRADLAAETEFLAAGGWTLEVH